MIDRSTSGIDRLTDREVEILDLYADGLESPRIADALGISTRTVDSHRRFILTKLDTHTITGAVAIVIRAGVIVLASVFTTTPRLRGGGWGRPVLKAVCDHSLYRHRLFDATGTEIPVTYYTCRRCAVPFFLGADGRPVDVIDAKECGCVWPHHECGYHAHPVNA